MENKIHQTLESVLSKMGISINKIRIEKTPEDGFRVNIETSHPNLMIGHRGENIGALQHLVKIILWTDMEKESGADAIRPEISLDIENYRRRQEQHILKLAERKVDMVRKLSSPQSLPAMAPYFRRLVHLHLAQDKFNDIRTESEGEGDYRYIVIKPEVTI
jgi:spoIIIJ-associated protein